MTRWLLILLLFGAYWPISHGKCAGLPGQNALDTRDFLVAYIDAFWHDAGSLRSSHGDERHFERLQSHFIHEGYRGWDRSTDRWHFGAPAHGRWVEESEGIHDIHALMVDGPRAWVLTQERGEQGFWRHDFRLKDGVIVTETRQFGTQTQLQQVVLSGMRFTWHFEGETLIGRISAPTSGWVVVGFNAKPDLEGARLIMGSIEDQGVRLEEHRAKPPHHTLIAEQGHLIVRSFQASERETMIEFEIGDGEGPAVGKPGQLIHLILGYSLDDDFNSHSHVRRQVDVVLRR